MSNEKMVDPIRKIWYENASIIRECNNKLEKITEEESQLQNQRRAQEIALSQAKRKAETIREYHVMMTEPPQKIKKLHERMIWLRRQSLKETITIAKKKEIDRDLSKLKDELQKACTHPFIIELHGYKGSHSDDYDDAYPEVRICVVCQHRDSRYVEHTPEKEYASLKYQAGRAIFRGVRAPKTREPLFDFYRPLDQIIESLFTPELKELQKEIEQRIATQNPL